MRDVFFWLKMSNSSIFSSKILSKNILVGFLVFVGISFFFSEIDSFLSGIMNDIGEAGENLNKRDAMDFFKSTGKVSIIKRLMDFSILST